MRAAATVIVLLATSACSIDSAPFESTIDAGNGRIVLNRPSISMNEGGSETVLVHLESPPMLPASIVCATADEQRLMSGPSQFTFTEGGPPEQSLFLDARQDADAMDESLMVICSSSNFDNGISTVEIADDDVLAIVAMPNGSPPVTVAEMQSTSIQVRLSAQPPTNLIVSVAHAGTKISTGPAVLTFTPSNYDLSQNVIVTGVRDADNVTDSDSLTLSSTGLTTVSVPISVTDID